MSKLTKELITEKVMTGLRHYLTDQTSWGRHEDGLQDVKIEMTKFTNEILIETIVDRKHQRYLIEISEET